MQKGFIDVVNELKPDFMCLQETKMQEGQAEVPLEGYNKYFNSAEILQFLLRIPRSRSFSMV